MSARKFPIKKPIVILPVYNEIETIESILELTLRQSPLLEILVIDDNSPDKTSRLVKNHKEYKQRVHLLQRPSKKGLGTAYKDGFLWALSRNYDACLEMDADLSHDPNDIPQMVSELNKGADMVVGSRYLNGVRVLNWPISRLLLSSFAGFYTRIITKMPLTDPTSGFKAIRRQVLENMDWSKFKAEGYGFQIELHFFTWKAGFIIKEIPIIFTERREGHSKMSSKIAMEAALRVITLAVTRTSTTP